MGIIREWTAEDFLEERGGGRHTKGHARGLGGGARAGRVPEDDGDGTGSQIEGTPLQTPPPVGTMEEGEELPPLIDLDPRHPDPEVVSQTTCPECGMDFWEGSGAGVYCTATCQVSCETRARWAAGVRGAALMRRIGRLRVWRATNHALDTPAEMLRTVAAVEEIMRDLGGMPRHLGEAELCEQL